MLAAGVSASAYAQGPRTTATPQKLDEEYTARIKKATPDPRIITELVDHMTITPTETKVTGDTAYDIGTYKQSLMAQKGGGMADDKGKYIVLLKKDASGAWLVTHAIYNSDNPPPGAATPKK